MIARVVPDVTGLDKHFDYVVGERWRDGVTVGTRVRVPLHGRRVAGWVVALDPPDDRVDPARLLEIAMVSSVGPPAELVELAAWASHRWAAGRTRPFLQVASPPTNVARTPPADRRRPPVPRPVDAVAELLAAGGGVLRWPPNDLLRDVAATAAGVGPALVVHPSVEGARRLAANLRREGWSVALVPDEWARAAGGVDVVVGTRRAAWAPCPDLAVVVVLDEHDEALQEERAPTWHARDVLVERARRRGVPVVLVSPCPTVVAQHERPLVRPPAGAERESWPIVEVVDRTRDEPWKTSLVTSPLIAHLRDHDRTVVCVHNTPGRARVLACRSCRSLVRCGTCAAAVGLDDDGRLACRRCGTVRPPVCLVCGAGGFANLRPGVTRLREELEAAAGRPVVAVTGADDRPPPDAGVYVGTEAALHRVGPVDTVAFLDIDTELLAPRYRADEQAMALLVRGARRAGRRAAGGRLLVQTFLPDHEVLRAAVRADPGRLLEGQRARRRLLELPPFGALAAVSGPGRDAAAEALRADERVRVGGGDPWLVRAATWERLGDALADLERPKGARLRIAVDPPRV